MAKSIVILSLIFGILAIGFGGFFAKDRIEIISNSDAYAATVVECKWSKRRSIGKRSGRARNSYAPVAVSEEGYRAIGRLKFPKKSICEKWLGHEVTIFVDRRDTDKARIHSLFQFWLAPIILLSFIAFGFACIFMRQVLATLIFFGAFLAGGTALALEFKVFSSPLEHPNLQPINAEKALDICIAQALREENIERPDRLKRLTCKRRDLTDLTPIARLTSLEALDLSLNQIVSVKPLGSLQSLRELTLDGNRNLQSLSGLEDLHGLEILKVQCAGLIEIDAVSALTNLRHLDVSCNQVSSLAPITNLAKLEKLNIDENPNITTIAAAANKPALDVITLYRVPVSDVSPLFGNTNLRRANIGNNERVSCAQIEDLRSRLKTSAKIVGPKSCIKPASK